MINFLYMLSLVTCIAVYIMVLTLRCGNESTLLNNTSNDITIESEATNGNLAVVNNVNVTIKNSNDITTVVTATTNQQSITGNIMSHIKITNESTAGIAFYLVASILNGIIIRDCNGSDRTDQLPTASSIVAAIHNCQINTSFFLILQNTGTDNVLTLGTSLGGITLNDTNILAHDQCSRWLFVVTNVGTPAISGYLINRSEATASGNPPSSDPFNTFAVTGVVTLSGLSSGFPMRRENNTGTDWTYTMYFRANSSIGSGDHDLLVAGLISLTYNRGNQNVTFKYGDTNNWVAITTNSTMADDTWYQIIVRLESGALGDKNSKVNQYYDRMRIYFNAVQESTTNTNSNAGIKPATNQFTQMTIGSGAGHFTWITIDDNRRSGSGITNIYNGGVTSNLALLTNIPEFWYKFNASNTTPNIGPTLGTGNLVLQSGTFDYGVYVSM